MRNSSKVTPQRVDQHRALAHQKITCFVQHQHRLLRSCLHRDEAHRRPRNRLGYRLRIRGVGLPRFT